MSYLLPCTVPWGDRREMWLLQRTSKFVKLDLIVKLFYVFKSTAFLLLTILKTKYV